MKRIYIPLLSTLLCLGDWQPLTAQISGKIPHEIRCNNLIPSPAVFSWYTDSTVHHGYVQIRAENEKKLLIQEKAISRLTTWDTLNLRQSHYVEIRGLQPATTYEYRVGADGYWSEWSNFRTVALAASFPASSIPDRIILTLNGDPATSMAATWRTDTTVVQGVAEIALATATPTENETERTVPNATRLEAVTENLKMNNVKTHHHSVQFTNLKPKTRYAYRVGDGHTWSEWLHFTTAGKTLEKFSFIYLGDAQNNIKSMFSRTIRQAFVQKPDARLIVHAGDLISFGEEWEWGAWFHAGGFMLGMIPSLPVSGNHEHTFVTEKNVYGPLIPNWRNVFTLPENGPETGLEDDYYLDYQNVRFISLNTTRFIWDPRHRERQLSWLQKILANNPNRWTFMVTHFPMGAVKALMHKNGKWDRQRSQFTEIKPMLDRYNVDLVMQGHIHQYMRGSEWEDEMVKTQEGGTMYVVSVAGPKMYPFKDLNKMKMIRKAQDLQLYQIVSVSQDTLSFESYTNVGELYDAFDLVKQPNGEPNKIINRIPDTPEHLQEKE